jgi:hypothetical protein
VHLELPEDVAAGPAPSVPLVRSRTQHDERPFGLEDQRGGAVERIRLSNRAELIGDVGLTLSALAERLEGRLSKAGALLPLREEILAHIEARADESRYPLTPGTDRTN